MLAVRDHVPALRALIADWSMRANHDLDFIDDVRLAVDEVCALTFANCTPEDIVTLRLVVEPSRVRIDARAPVRPTDDEPMVDGLSMRVLEALADSFDHGIDGTASERIFRLSFGRWRQPPS
jgi:serine/threonine-protein kinase RsbW